MKDMTITLNGLVGWVRVGSFLAVCLLLAACGKKEAAPDPVATQISAEVAATQPPDPVDLTAFNQAFANAQLGLKLFAEETVAVIRARNFGEALDQIQKVSKNPALTPEQRQAMQDLAGKLQALRR